MMNCGSYCNSVIWHIFQQKYTNYLSTVMYINWRGISAQKNKTSRALPLPLPFLILIKNFVSR